ncbi:MAG TPA: helix-turn-helix transcriptional regulator [Acidimicrobiales bacterium]
MTDRRSVEELEAEIGRHLRARRIDKGLRQVEVAERANISTTTLSHLEAGKGANLTTLAKVLRVLEADDWIDRLALAPEFSPLAVLEQATSAGGTARARRPRQRVRVRVARTASP